MADVHDKKTRSFNMSKIGGKDTKPELLVRRFLHAQGFRFRLHVNSLPGKPDIVLKRYKTIIDVRGCFWHNHSSCKYGEKVITGSEVVTEKRKSAVLRDSLNYKNWKKTGWQVIVIWADCELEPKKKFSRKREKTLIDLINKLKIENTNN